MGHGACRSVRVRVRAHARVCVCVCGCVRSQPLFVLVCPMVQCFVRSPTPLPFWLRRLGILISRRPLFEPHALCIVFARLFGFGHGASKAVIGKAWDSGANSPASLRLRAVQW